MSESSVDIHVRLSPDGVQMLKALMEFGRYTSKSAYIEEMIMAIESIFAGYYTYYKISLKTETDKEKLRIWEMFSQYMLALLRRLGWVAYRKLQDEEKLNASVRAPKNAGA